MEGNPGWDPGVALKASGAERPGVRFYLPSANIVPSSNGRTADSDSVNRGSNPCGTANKSVNNEKVER